MIVHLGNGGCPTGWRIQYLNAIAEQVPEFSKNLIEERLPWLRAATPKKSAWEKEQVPDGCWISYLCDVAFDKRVSLTEHLQESHLKDCPELVSCPSCKAEFTKISGLLQHIETTRCSADYEGFSIVALIDTLEYEVSKLSSELSQPDIECRLGCHPRRPSELLVIVSQGRSL